MGLPTAEIMFSKGNNFHMASVIVIRTHGHNTLDIIDLEDWSSHRRHLDQVRFKTYAAQEEAESQKPEQLQQIGLKKPLGTVAANDVERTKESDEDKMMQM